MTETNYSKIIHDTIISANKLVIEANKEKYNMLLKFMNELIKPESKYTKITQFKYINQKNIEIDDKIIESYIDNFKKMEIKLNPKNKNPFYIIKQVANKLGYSLNKKQYNDDFYYSVVYK